uniref:Uncharacterized protein n=2 Tax=cellular organisms TaxID=131567 RepID=A0A0A8YIR4_ARUDO
MEGGGAGGGAA